LPRLADIHLDWRHRCRRLSRRALVLARSPVADGARGVSAQRRRASSGNARTPGRGGRADRRPRSFIGTSLLARSFLLVLPADRGYRSDHVLSFTTGVR
jgi:hypothetical protein